MPCLCGDTNCPSCGPAQGYNPEAELVCEWLTEVVFADAGNKDFPSWVDIPNLASIVAERFGFDQDIADLFVKRAKEWDRKLNQKIRNANIASDATYPTKYYCASPDCPGLPYKASDCAHPCKP